MFMKPDMKIKKSVSIIGWALCTFIILFACFITWTWNQGHYPSPVVGAIYAASFRSLWALAMAWIVIACHYGHGGVISTILDWPPFIPMSRVSYTAYLIHPGLMYVFVASTRNLFMFGHFLVMYLFLAHLLATFLASFFLSLIIEIPFITFEQSLYVHFFGRSKGSKSTPIYNPRPAKYFYNVNHPIEVNFSQDRGATEDIKNHSETSSSSSESINFGSKTSTPLVHHHHGHQHDHISSPVFALQSSSKYHHHVTHHHNHDINNVLTQRMTMYPLTSPSAEAPKSEKYQDNDDVPVLVTSQSMSSTSSSESSGISINQSSSTAAGKIYTARL